MGFFKRHEYIIVIVGAITAVGLAIGLPFVTHPTEALLPRLTLAQLALSGAALFIVAVTLYLTIVQVRKAMAKPQLMLAFSKDEKTETTINIPKDRKEHHNLNLWIINKGNAVTELFQLEFEIPDIFESEFRTLISSMSPHTLLSNPPSNKGTKILSFCNKGNFCAFVNSAVEFPLLILWSLPERFREYEKEYEIRYRVFGDWAETQEGKLKIKVNKQEED